MYHGVGNHRDPFLQHQKDTLSYSIHTLEPTCWQQEIAMRTCQGGGCEGKSSSLFPITYEKAATLVCVRAGIICNTASKLP